MPRRKKAVQERVSRVRSSENSGRGKDQYRTVVTRATTLRGTPALPAADSRSTQRQRNSTISSTSQGVSTWGGVANRSTRKRAHEPSTNNQAPRRQRTRISAQNVPDVHESQQPDTSESELDTNQEDQNLLTQADIPRIIEAVMSNLSVQDTSPPPPDPPQGPSGLGKCISAPVLLPLECVCKYIYKSLCMIVS